MVLRILDWNVFKWCYIRTVVLDCSGWFCYEFWELWIRDGLDFGIWLRYFSGYWIRAYIRILIGILPMNTEKVLFNFLDFGRFSGYWPMEYLRIRLAL